ncbi:envelope integrity protein Cei [Pseudonocardia sp. H11422]|uniref:envelope integrity protein Cei n=1 Tax=Pseudonocardia sp. H11422 TaxID=2835866 RepID=UPI001BDC3F6C|nr:envelope integrity protein Cei [Pseudonocardia sp. H11422]
MAPGARNRPYQRRRSRPIIVVVSVLFALSAVTWSVVLVQASGRSGAAACTPPAQGAVPGEVLAGDALNEVPPVPASAIRVRVLNAGGQRGQANLVAAQLGDLGFAEAAAPSNDPLYPEGDLNCRGQLRFGQAGEGAASTLALVLPCTELVRDDRLDGTVDVAVGTAFGDVSPGRAARDALDELAGPAVTGTDGSANTGNGGDTPPTAPVVDPDVLEKAREVSC